MSLNLIMLYYLLAVHSYYYYPMLDFTHINTILITQNNIYIYTHTHTYTFLSIIEMK